MAFELPGIPDVSLTWILLAVLPILFYIYAIRPLSVFKKMGVPGPQPWPVLGNLLGTLRRGLYDIDGNVKNLQQYGEVYGTFFGATPVLMVSDSEMLREILIKQFHNFSRRTHENLRINTTPNGRYLINLVGEDWKNVRSTITPAFSSGKLRLMSEQLNRCANIMAENVAGFAESNKTFNARELTGGFAMDVIASTAFGTEIDSQRNPEDPFVVHGKEGLNFNISSPVTWLFLLFPGIVKPILEAFDLDGFPRESYKFFENVFDQLMAMRREGGTGRVDFMQLMANAHNEEDEENKETNMGETTSRSHKKALTKADVVSNGILFFLAGYDTTSLTMAYTLYNLALHQEAQDKVIREIDDVIGDKEDFDYETMNELTYLEMCIMETLRLYPPGANVISRHCENPTVVKGLSIPKGIDVRVPILAIHHDPKRYPEPTKFIPERFTKEERETRDPFHYLPFGAGPRNCIGMRLAMLEARYGLAKVLKKCRILPCPETQVPLKFKKFESFPVAEKGVMLKAELRNKFGE